MGFIVVLWERGLLGGEFQSESKTNEHWIYFNKSRFVSEGDDNFYLTVTIDLEKNLVKAFCSGDSVGENNCNEEYLDKNLICDDSIPFTIGMMVGGFPTSATYSSFKLYGCRFYDRILSDEEIKLNYESSKGLLNNID